LYTTYRDFVTLFPDCAYPSRIDDLERPSDANKLRDPEAFFTINADKLICLDEINSSKLGASLGVSHHTIRSYIDLMEQAFILRVLPPYEANVKKRLVKTPKVFIRDPGLLHTLLGIETQNDLSDRGRGDGDPARGVSGPNGEGLTLVQGPSGTAFPQRVSPTRVRAILRVTGPMSWLSVMVARTTVVSRRPTSGSWRWTSLASPIATPAWVKCAIHALVL